MTGQAPRWGTCSPPWKSLPARAFVLLTWWSPFCCTDDVLSASFKLTNNPDAVHLIHEVIGVPLALIPVLALCEIAGGVGLLAGIWRPKLGVAGAAGLVLYSSEQWWLT